MRIYLFPQSILTWANLNFTLCHPLNDPFYPIWGNNYYFIADVYLNVVSVFFVLFTLVGYALASAPIVLA